MKPTALCNRKLSIALAVQICLIVLLWWPRESGTVGKKELFSGFDFKKLQEVEISETAENKVVLKKIAGKWVVPAQMDYPADEKKLSELFEKVEKLNLGYPVVQTKAAYERLNVSEEKYQRKVALIDPGEKSAEAKHGFYLGTSPQYRKTHIRKFEDKDVYTTAALGATDLPILPQDWIEKKLTDINPDHLVSIDLKRGTETVVFVRKEIDVPKPKKPKAEKAPDADEVSEDKPAEEVAAETVKEKVWFIVIKGEEKKIDKARFDHILRNIVSLNLNQVLGKDVKPEYGLAKPQAEITIHTLSADGKPEEQTIVIGAKKDPDYVAHIKDSPFYVSVLPYLVKDVLDLKVTDLVAKK